MMIKPQRLRPGDTVATISLSWGGPAVFPHRYAAGKRQLAETFGLNVVETRHALRDADWLARNPQARAEDLMEAFADPAIKAIIATIGGDDSIRLLPHIDLSVIRDNPKIFMGYSDTTVAHLACYAAGLVSFYGPSVMAGFGENAGILPYTADAVEKLIFTPQPLGSLEPNRDGWTVEFLDWGDPSLQQRPRALQPVSGWRWLQGGGVREGRLIGGCVEVLDWLRGTPIWPDREAWRDAILFLETSEEAPAPEAVTRMLRAIAATGACDQLAGVLFGRPGGQVPPEHFADYDAALCQVFAEELGMADLPIISHMDFGHTDPMCVLPYGIQARIDCDQQRITLLEAAVI